MFSLHHARHHGHTDPSARGHHWRSRLEAGRKYDLLFEFFEQGSAATAKLSWENPCQSREAIPQRQLYPVGPAAPVCPVVVAPGTGTGLRYQFFTGEPGQTGALATGTHARVDFDWGNGAPASGVPTNFGARWTGTLEAPIDGPLTIYLHTDDVGGLRLGGMPLLDSWSEPFGPQEVAATVDVHSGQRYDIAIDLRDGGKSRACFRRAQPAYRTGECRSGGVRVGSSAGRSRSRNAPAPRPLG
jgi:hypothetical protein